MTWTVTHAESDHVIEIIWRGPTTLEDFQQCAGQVAALAREHRVKRFLSDCREIRFDGNFSDLYDVPTQYEREAFDRTSRGAIIRPTSGAEKQFIDFYEITCQNRGWLVKIFDGRPGAIAWLLSQQEPMEPSR